MDKMRSMGQALFDESKAEYRAYFPAIFAKSFRPCPKDLRVRG